MREIKKIFKIKQIVRMKMKEMCKKIYIYHVVRNAWLNLFRVIRAVFLVSSTTLFEFGLISDTFSVYFLKYSLYCVPISLHV